MPRVSLTMIVKDEEANLADCLKSVADLVDEMVVVDTGSTDRTKEIAAGLGARVIDFPWCDNFAAARNEAINHATGDWIFWLDADDRLDEDNRRRLKDLLAGLGDENRVYLMRCACLPDPVSGSAAVLRHARLFRNRSDVRWQYRVHEQILPAALRAGAEKQWSDVIIRHTGYQDPAARYRKLERNLRLCRLDAAEYPGDPYVKYQLGRTLVDLGQPREALPLLRQCLEGARPESTFARGAYQWLSVVLQQLGQRKEALDVCREGKQRFPDHHELLFHEAILLMQGGEHAAAEECLRELLRTPPVEHPVGALEPGVHGYLARHNLALICLHQKRFAEADAYWSAAAAERPDFAPAWLGLGDLWALQGRIEEFERTARRLETDPQRATEVALVRGRGHMARRDFAAARQVLTEAIARAPQAPAPRLLLAHAYFQEGRDLAAAEETLRGLLALAPHHVEARLLLERVQRARASAPATPGRRRARVSLTMIVKNEERNIGDCLKTVADLMDEVIVVDTGSTDRTREIASRFGAKVVDFPWRDDFAAARNEGLRHATGEWVLWLDADDRIDEENRAKLRALLAGLGNENRAYILRCVCPPDAVSGGAAVVSHPRLFRRHPNLRWRYRVHEQILPSLQELGGALQWADVVIRHVGYQDPAERRRKVERNQQLGQLDVAEFPDDPFVLYNLGRTRLELGQPAQAVPLLRQAMQRVRPDDAIVPALYQWLASAHHQAGQRREALETARAGRTRFPDNAEMLFREGLILCEMGEFAAAEPCLRRLLELPPPPRPIGTEDPGVRGHVARHNLALLCLHQKRFAEAEANWLAAVNDRPDFAPAWFGLGDLWAGMGRLDEFEKMAHRLDQDPRRAAEATLVRARGHMARKNFPVARDLLVGAIARTPQALGPRLLLAHALVQEGRDWAVAEQALQDVLALVPGHAQARSMLERVQRERARPPAPPAPVPVPTLPLAPGRPRPTVSLTMIVKNEERNIGDCLKTAADLVDEIVVVDTGSKDRTKEIATSLGAKVYDFPWCDNFAAARNEALKHATGDWIFWLDADDRITEENRQRAKALFARLGEENVAYMVKCRCLADEATRTTSEVDHARLFRNHPQIRWRYRVHEQILPSVERLGGSIRTTDLVVEHTGYQERALEKEKLKRNLRLLHEDDIENPNDPLTLFNIGWTYQCLGRADEALPFLRRSLERCPPGFAVVRKVYAVLVQAYRVLGQVPEALEMCRQGLERFPDDAELLFRQGLMQLDTKDYAAAERSMRLLLAPPSRTYVAMGVREGLRGWRAHDVLGQICREQGRLAESEEHWKKVVNEQATYLRAWLMLSDLYISQERWADLEQAIRRLETEVNLPTEAKLLKARERMARKDYTSARRLVEEAIAQAPGAIWAREMLTHVLMAEGRDWAAAEKAILDVLAMDPGNAPAKQNLAAVQARRRAG
jgi:glycosyltransferase involved in cell wall biosynthesis/Tfp pilus assembly protein PilF